MFPPFLSKPVLALTTLALAGLLLAACATLSKEECLVTDWQALGERDGAAGRSLDHFARHVKACAKTNAAPDQTAWQRGHADGLRRFCTPQNGVAVGNGGQRVAALCPADLQPGFQRGYTLGREREALLSTRQNAAFERRAALREAEEIEDDIRDGKTAEREGAAEIRMKRRIARDRLRRIDDIDSDIRRLDRRIVDAGLVAPVAPQPVD